MRRLALIAALFAAAAAGAATVAGADDTHTYKLEMYDAFGLVPDAEVKVAGVNAGTITDLDINEEKRALVTIELSGPLAVLGDETECKSEPQSLIAEYFLDCQPAGEPLPDGATVPKLVTQTVQNDLVLNTMRLPYRQRLSLLINEFGTALAGNPENLNEAIRMGAPALQDLHAALRILAQQNRTIAQLNVDSDQIVGKLEARTQDVVRFVEEAGDTAVASAARRDDLSTDFDLLDDVLRELNPTMAELENVAVGDDAAPCRPPPRRPGPEHARDQPARVRARHRALAGDAREGVEAGHPSASPRPGRDPGAGGRGGPSQASRQAGPPVPRRHRRSAPGGASGCPRGRGHRAHERPARTARHHGLHGDGGSPQLLLHPVPRHQPVRRCGSHHAHQPSVRRGRLRPVQCRRGLAGDRRWPDDRSNPGASVRRDPRPEPAGDHAGLRRAL